MTNPKQPPDGVETTPRGSIVSLRDAATRLGKDPRTVMRLITEGRIRGGALPRPQRLRWYVYADQLPPTSDAQIVELEARVAELKARLISMVEVNRLLIDTQRVLLELADANHPSRVA